MQTASSRRNPHSRSLAGPAGEFRGVRFDHRVVNVEDDRLAGKKGNQSGKHEEVRHVVDVNDIEGLSGQLFRAFEEGKEGEPKIG